MPANRVKVDRAVQPEVVAVEIFAALMAAVGLLLSAQAVSRRLQIDAVDNPTLDALGTTRRERFVTNLMTVSFVAVAGAGLSVLIAVLLSPIGPVGVARAAQPHAGFEADWALFLLAGLLLAVLVVVVSLYPAWRYTSARGPAGTAHSSGLWRSLSSSGLPVSAVTGIRFALDAGRARAAVPVRSTLLGAVTAVAVVAGVLTFSGSLNHLLDTPRLFGSDWDAAVSGDSSLDDGD